MNKTTLSEADKKRIEEEEKFRAKVRKGLNENSKQKSQRYGAGCLLVVIVFVVLGIISSGLFSDKKEEADKPSPTPERTFKASVQFTGTQFIITNLDDLDCQDAKMVINGGLFKGGYILEGHTLETDEAYEVGALQFAKSDGARFNPIEMKPNDFLILCRGDNALNDTGWSGSFN